MSNHTASLSRRQFLKRTGSGLLVGVFLPRLAGAEGSGAAAVIKGDGAPAGPPPNAFVHIAPDDTVTVIVKHIEFGQGPYTGLATLVAEELDARWSQMRARSAPANNDWYKNLAFGIQGTGGSTAIRNSWLQMRSAGAAARAMLVAAAADAWGVSASEISVRDGVIRHPSGKHSGFGALANAAAKRTPPAEPRLKDPSDFHLIGTVLPKLDTDGKTDGSAQFTLDVYRDDMLTVAVAHPPRFGATVRSVDGAAARAVAGVVDVKTIAQGVAVYARNTYAALRGRDALKVEWDDSGAETRSTARILAEFRAKATSHGAIATDRGDAAAAIAAGDTRLEATYEFPYLAHAPMEALDSVIELAGGRARVWMGSQLQTVDQGTIAGVLGIEPAMVSIETQLAGGSFGRRAQPDSGFAAEAAAAAKALGRDAVTKLVWTREDDIRGGRYRPLTVHRLAGALDDKGDITAWEQVVASQSIMAGSPFEGMIRDGVDPTMVEGASDLPYRIPSLRVSAHIMQAGVPVLWWRSVGHTHTAYVVETFIDELLVAGGRDPVEGRLAMLDDRPRESAVLRAAAELADWGGAVPEGRARGVAVHKSFESYVAQVAEVSRGPGGIPRVHRVWCAVDCGIAVNPDVVRAQMEGGIGYGLGAALFDAITLDEGGTVSQSNFHDYRSLRIDEMPSVEVRIVASGEAPSGVGEPGTPPIAPAVANAWRALTGDAVRSLPFVQARS